MTNLMVDRVNERIAEYEIRVKKLSDQHENAVKNFGPESTQRWVRQTAEALQEAEEFLAHLNRRREHLEAMFS